MRSTFLEMGLLCLANQKAKKGLTDNMRVRLFFRPFLFLVKESKKINILTTILTGFWLLRKSKSHMWNAVYSVKNVHLNKHKKTGQKTSSKETKWSEKVIKAQKTSRALLLLTKNLTAKKKNFQRQTEMT